MDEVTIVKNEIKKAEWATKIQECQASGLAIDNEKERICRCHINRGYDLFYLLSFWQKKRIYERIQRSRQYDDE